MSRDSRPASPRLRGSASDDVDPNAPDASAFGARRLISEAPGASETVVVPWPLLLRRRVVRRVEGSDRYRWWVLTTCLTGLFAVGITITILTISLPRLARDLHSDTSTMTWVITGPL